MQFSGNIKYLNFTCMHVLDEFPRPHSHTPLLLIDEMSAEEDGFILFLAQKAAAQHGRWYFEPIKIKDGWCNVNAADDIFLSFIIQLILPVKDEGNMYGFIIELKSVMETTMLEKFIPVV
jgi:hypothetical protein